MKASRLPDFAGVALVDILANGLAMLIIVIVLSIAARAEQEQRTAEQVEEVETMMSRKFSTSLVLNSLAASPPAQLHNYRNSPHDQELSAATLPILELHRGFVREFYSGTIWHREELLREPNAMDDWLSTFDEARRQRMRADIYDITQFYLVMSILRDHGIAVRHWHFLSTPVSLADAARCPPGVAAEDCAGGLGDGVQTNALPALASDGRGGGGDSDGWPPRGATGVGEGDTAGRAGPFPGGAVLDSGQRGQGGRGGEIGAGNTPMLGAGSFPDARPGLGAGFGSGARGLLGTGTASGQGQRRARFRLSHPQSLRQQPGQQLGWGNPPPSTAQILAVLLDFIGNLQATLDAGASPAAQLANFEQHIFATLRAPPQPQGRVRGLIRALAADIGRRPGGPSGTEDALKVIPLQYTVPNEATNRGTTLIMETNRRLRHIAVGRAHDDDTKLPATAHPALRMNAHPDIWQGLSLPLQAHAILLMPPVQMHPQQLRWRALAYVAPNFDDFIIGFTYAAVDSGGRLVVQADDNRVRLNSRALLTPYRPPLFGVRGWLAALYGGLILLLLGAVLAVRRLTVTQTARGA